MPGFLIVGKEAAVQGASYAETAGVQGVPAVSAEGFVLQAALAVETSPPEEFGPVAVPVERLGGGEYTWMSILPLTGEINGPEAEADPAAGRYVHAEVVNMMNIPVRNEDIGQYDRNREFAKAILAVMDANTRLG